MEPFCIDSVAPETGAAGPTAQPSPAWKPTFCVNIVAKPPWALELHWPDAPAPTGVLLRLGGGVSVKVGVKDGVRVGLPVGNNVLVAGMRVGSKAAASVE